MAYDRNQMIAGLRAAVDAGDNAAANEMAAILDTMPEPEETTIAGNLWEAAKGVPRGFLNSTLTSIEGLAEIADAATNQLGYEDLIDSGDENELIRLARAGREGVSRAIPMNPDYHNSFIPLVGEGFGSVASFMIPSTLLFKAGNVAKLAGSATFAGGLGAGEQAQRIQVERDAGAEISEDTEDLAVFGGTAVGFTELMPIFKFLRKVPINGATVDGTRGLMKQFRNWMKSKDISVGSMALTGGEEALQEAGAGLMQDFIAKKLYDPDLEIGQSVLRDAEVGGTVGAIADFAFRAMSGGRRRVFTENDRAREAKLDADEQNDNRVRYEAMDAEAKRLEEGAEGLFNGDTESLQVTDTDADSQAYEIIGQMGGSFPTATYFRSEGNTVVDAQGRKYGGDVSSTEKAVALAQSLNRVVTGAQVEAVTEELISSSGENYTPEQRGTIRNLARNLLSPSRQMFTAEQISLAENDADFLGLADRSPSDHSVFSHTEALEMGVPVSKLTPLQKFQYNRERKGEAPRTEFTPSETKKILGDKFGRLVDVEAGMPRTYMAGTYDGEIIVKDTLGEGEAYGPYETMEEAVKVRDGLNLDKGYSAGIHPSLFEDPDIAADEIRQLLKDKNIADDLDSRAVRSIAEAITGRKARGRTKVRDFDAGEKRVLYHALRRLPRFDTPTKLPDFTLKPKARPQLEPSDSTSGPLLLEGPSSGTQAIAKAVRQALKGFGLERVGSNIVERIMPVEGDSAGNLTYGAVYNEQTGEVDTAGPAPMGTEGQYVPWLDQIFIGLENIRSRTYNFSENGPVRPAQPGEPLTQEQIQAAVLDVLNHEIIHAMRQGDLFTQQEWEMLERAARDTISPDTGVTYWQEAMATYSDRNAVVQIEESVANLTRDVLNGKVKLSGKPRSLLRRMVEFLKKMFKVTTKAGYESPAEVMEAIKQGDIGARQTGEIRSMRRAEKEAVQARNQQVAPRMSGDERPETSQPLADFGDLYSKRPDTARIERAKAEGFDTDTVYYHGTDVTDITSFKGDRGVAGHFSKDPEFAETFVPA